MEVLPDEYEEEEDEEIPSHTPAGPAAPNSASPAPPPTAPSAPAASAAPAGSPEAAPAAQPAPAQAVPAPVKSPRQSKAEEAIKKNQYDTESWLALLAEAQAQGPAAQREAFEAFLRVFPTSGRHWKAYVDMEISHSEYDKAEAIFRRCLVQCLSVELWLSYLGYVKLTPKSASDPEELTRAYEFALQHIGLDIGSAQIWTEYIAHLKATPGPQTIGSLRKLYQRAFQNPMHGMETFWREYEAFENTTDQQLAPKMISEFSPKFNATRSVFREKKVLMEGIQRTMIARPPHGSAKEEHQVNLWKRLIAFEKSYVAKLEKTVFVKRVSFCYNLCLQYLYHYPEIWLEAARFQEEQGNMDEALALYNRGLVAIPDCLLLHFAMADFLELHKRAKEARDVYEKLIEGKSGPLAWIHFMRFARRAESMEEARKVFLRARKSPECSMHVFVASAMMEFFQNKDATIARRIFDTGMKQYSKDVGYVKRYAELLTHMNEDGNLRAMFERVLPDIEKEKSIELWNMFVNFERTAGDLESALKVENRRKEALGEFDAVHSSVEKYQFMDLLPCSTAQLNSFSIGKDSVGAHPLDGKSVVSGSKPQSKQYARPNLTQWKVFTPESSLFAQGAASGVPRELQDLLRKLPQAQLFQGPLVDTDQLIALILRFPPSMADGNREPTGQGIKRRHPDDSFPDHGAVNRPPAVDVYRQRQADKAARQNA
eukprot:m51a1_g2615 putative tetratricopeptide repeat domain containing protein (713) ;mRNA; r:517754-520562